MKNLNQHADGENIVQVGGDINNAPRPVNAENLIHCPECEQLVSRYAASCLACGFPVERFFAERVLLARRQRNERITLICMVLILIFGTGMIYFTLPDDVEWKGYIPFVSASAIAFALGYRRLMRKLAEWGL